MIVNVSDSSGAYTARILKVYKRTGIPVPKVGEIVTISVKTARPGTSNIGSKNKAKRKSILKALIIRNSLTTSRRDGSYIRFSETAIVILHPTRKNQPLATRVFGPVSHELRKKGYAKIISLGSITI